MELGFRNAGMYRLEFFAIGPGCEYIAAASCHSREDLSNLLGSLAGRIDHLRHADAQWAVMVDFREAKIFEGKMAQPSNRLFGRKVGIANLLEQLAKCPLVHCLGDV